MTTTVTATTPASSTTLGRRSTVFPRPLLGRLTAAWCATFAGAHAYWALGGRTGIDPAVPDIATRPVFLAYDVLAGLVLLAGAVLALGVAAGRVPARHVVATRGAANVGGALLLLRGVVGVGQDLVAVVTNEHVGAGWTYDAWFVVAGVLFLALAVRVRR